MPPSQQSENIVAAGQAGAEIMAAAERLGADLVVMFSRPRSGWRRFWREGTALKVLCESNRPVLVIPEGVLEGGQEDAPADGAAMWRNILVTVGLAQEGLAAVRYAAQWAKPLRARLCLFQILNRTGRKGEPNPFRAAGELNASVLGELTAEQIGAGIQWELLPKAGMAQADVILQAAAEVRSNLVVLSLEESGVRLAKELLRANACAVLAVPRSTRVEATAENRI
jgi:nucleotide-binding universal stress UspA family protein